MKSHKLIYIIWIVIIILAFLIINYFSTAHAITGDKYDGDCTANAIQGRCADKCPPGSYEIGTKDDGSSICKTNPTGCPYGDSVPLGPECDKLAPVTLPSTSENAQPQASITPEVPVNNDESGGK